MGKIKDLKNTKINKLYITDQIEIRKENNNHSHAYWLCKCECGNSKWIRGSSLSNKSVVSCGCEVSVKNSILLRQRMKEKWVRNLCGKRFGRLLVTHEYKRVKSGKSFVTKWLCVCDCGNKKWVQSSSLTSATKPTKSCGCLAAENASKANKKEYGYASMNAIYCQYKIRAKRKKISFELSMEDFKRITQQKCFYCGSMVSNTNSPIGCNGAFHYNGIDRIDNNVGYEKDNCVPCCSVCVIEQKISCRKKIFLIGLKEFMKIVV
jgi:hypothetical protein